VKTSGRKYQVVAGDFGDTWGSMAGLWRSLSVFPGGGVGFPGR
jgi:hypothetical protein